jgi:hypothetical protein
MDANLVELIQAISERQQTLERQVGELSAAVKALEAWMAELNRTVAASKAVADVPQNKPEVTPEILVMLAAAATAFLGKEVRIRSARMLETPYEVVNPWAQQGRVFVQASHNIQMRPRR